MAGKIRMKRRRDRSAIVPAMFGPALFEIVVPDPRPNRMIDGQTLAVFRNSA
jgi:hypothetical protein